MNVKLLSNTPLYVASQAIRTCWNSHEKSDTKIIDGLPYEVNEDGLITDIIMAHGDMSKYSRVGKKDKELIDRVGNKFKHASTLEHLVYTFYIEGISRACLQELARHRIASLSVKSTRYTLKELKKEESFISFTSVKNWLVVTDGIGNKSWFDIDRASNYIVLTGDDFVDACSVMALNNLRDALMKGISNDKAKYCLPESYKTELTWTINARSLQNFLSLRSDKSALWEIRKLAYNVYKEIPEDHKYLFKEYLK
jgi:thymidylate synthase (FAD)